MIYPKDEELRTLVLEYAELTHRFGVDSREAKQIRERYRTHREFQTFADAVDDFRNDYPSGGTRRYR